MGEFDILKRIKDVHYFQLSSQGNVYTLTTLYLANGMNKVLAASLKREIFCFEYPDNTSNILTPTTKEVLFTYIPGVAEIISIDAFNKAQTENDFVIGITITKSGADQDQPRENYLNIYSAWEARSDFNLENIAQNCLSVELSFIPYHLYHTVLPTWAEDGSVQTEMVWLLSGSDEKIHLYQEVEPSHSYKEVDLHLHFPDLEDPPSIVMWTDILYYNNYTRRISAYGCECGFVKLSVVDTRSMEVLETHSLIFENTVSSVRVFGLSAAPGPHDSQFHLLIVNTIVPSVVCSDVLENGLKKQQELDSSDLFNVSSCCCIADIDFDAQNEILIGTYGQELLAYKWYPERGWVLSGVKTFAQPIYSIAHLDVTGDGLREIIVLSIKGVHILQHDLSEVQGVLEEKAKLLELSL